MVYIIAEAGSNYNGRIDLAFELNEAAKKSGADCIKYQIIYPEGLYRTGSYPYGQYSIKDVIETRSLNVLSDDEWWQIKEHAESLGMDFSASIFDIRGLDLLKSMKVKFVKVASTDLNNHIFLRQVAQSRIPIFLSTGMSTFEEIKQALVVLDQENVDMTNFVLMHCVSSYPTLIRDTNLNFIHKLSSLNLKLGFSDHTLGVVASSAALSLGIQFIEKHFTLDNNLKGFDHKHSLNPDEMKMFIESLRELQHSLNYKGQKVGPSEKDVMARARRGVYASRNLTAGHKVGVHDLLIVRPPTDIPADAAEGLIGKIVVRDLKAGEPFHVDNLSTR